MNAFSDLRTSLTKLFKKRSSAIRILGPRSSGKTTYLAALIGWQNPAKKDDSMFTVEALDGVSEKFKRNAANLLCQKEELAGTDYEENVSDYKTYTFNLTFNSNFSTNPIQVLKKERETIQVS